MMFRTKAELRSSARKSARNICKTNSGSKYELAISHCGHQRRDFAGFWSCLRSRYARIRNGMDRAAWNVEQEHSAARCERNRRSAQDPREEQAARDGHR